MFDIYIKNFNRNGSLVQTETLIQTIPAASEGGLRLISPQIKNEMGNAESFDFSIEPNTPYYDAFLQMKTMIRVEYDGDNIFFGRILTVENNRFSGLRKIRCEGAISLLMDSPVKGVKEGNRSKISTFTYICNLIESHNNYLADADKHFNVGQVPGNYAGVNYDQKVDEDTRKFGSDSWSDTKSALEDLRSHFGGYFRTRTSKIGNGIYLDWLDNYFNPTTNAQKIQISKNLLDISDITEVDNIFTVLVPLGTYQSSSTSSGSSSSSSSSSTTDNTMYIDGTYLSVPDILSEFSYPDLNRGYHRAEDYANSIRRYGAIFKTVQFSNATSKSDLREKACEWIKDNYYGELIKYTIKAIDMRQIGENTSKIMVGDLVELVYPVIKEDGTDIRESKVRTCMSVTYDLYHPENNSYTFGIPANILTSMYGISNTSSVSSNSTSAGGNGGTAEEKSSDPWALIRDWLADHKMYYDWETWGNSYFPWKTDYDGVNLDGKHMHSPNSNYEYLYSAGRYIYKFSYTIDSWYDGQTYKELLSLEGAAAALDYKREHYVWRYTIDTSNKYIDEDNYVEILQDYNIREYVLMEYGFDLLAWSGAGENGTITSGDETYMTIIDRILDPASGINIPILKIGASVVKGATNLIDTINDSPLFKWAGFKLDPFDLSIPSQNEQPESYTDAEGTLHWYYEDPKNPGTYIETTNRSLNLMAVNSDNFIGTMVTQDYADADGNIHNYKFGLGIEEWAHGELVVAHVEGDATYIGGRDSMYTATTSLQHMDSICGDFTYETDEDGIQYVNINSAGGMRITSFKRDENGDPIVGEDGKYITAEFGVFDDNNLNAGVIAAKLNNNHTNTKLFGDIVQIGNKTATETISDIEQDLIDKGNSITTIGGNLTQAQADIVTNAQAIYGHGVSIAAINSDITAINSNITLIGEDLTDAQLDIAANGQSITAINTDIVDITGQLNAVKANFNSLFSKDGQMWVLGVDEIYVQERLHMSGGSILEASDADISNLTLSGSMRFYEDGAYFNDCIINAEVDKQNSNILHLYKASDPNNPINFSKAVSSWTDLWDANGNLSVRANPQNQTHSIPMELRAEGQSQYDNMDVVLGSTANGTFTARKKKYIYLTLDSTGSSATVSARADSKQGTAYASISVSDVWTAGYNYNLPSGISIGSLTNAGTSTPSGATNVSAFSTSSIWSDFPNTYGYLKFPVTVHGKTKDYYFAFDNRKLSSGGNPAYGAGYSDGYNYNLPSGISIGSLTNAGTSTPSGATNVSAFSTSSIWSDFPNTYGYLKFPVTVHGKTKDYYFAFDNRKLSSGGNPAYAAGYSAGRDVGWNAGWAEGYEEGKAEGGGGVSIGDVSIESIAVSTYQPTGYDGAVYLTELPNAIKNNHQTYVWFKVRVRDTDNQQIYSKYYYCASAN